MKGRNMEILAALAVFGIVAFVVYRSGMTGAGLPASTGATGLGAGITPNPNSAAQDPTQATLGGAYSPSDL